MTASAASGAGCASPMLRDRFLNALDASDHVALRDLARQRGLAFFEISSATGQGVDELKFAMGERVLPAVKD